MKIYVVILSLVLARETYIMYIICHTFYAYTLCTEINMNIVSAQLAETSISLF